VEGAHPLMKEDDVVKPTIKGLCISKDLALSLVTETYIGPSLVSGGTRNSSHVLRQIV